MMSENKPSRAGWRSWGNKARFLRDRSGNVAMLFGLAAIPFFAMGGLAIDYSRAMMVKNRLGTALDSTALALGSQVGLTDAQAEAQARIYFKANYPDSELGTPSALSISRTLNTVSISATASVDTVVLGLVGVNELDVSADVTVNRSSVNLEVALVVDVTGSMAGSKIANLISAANDVVDIIVQPTQSPYFSKMALIPFSAAVNIGVYADSVRGAPRADSRNIGGATRASPVVITSTNHGYQNGERVYISGVNGMTSLNNQIFRVGNRTTDTFALYSVATGNPINGTTYSNWTSGGTARCGSPGCLTLTYFNSETPAEVKRNDDTTCVTERVGTQAYTDAAPSLTNPIAWLYPDNTSRCLSSLFMPMTSNKAVLHAAIDDFEAEGSTAGQIGLAWGWYALSPNFASIWGGEGAALPYGTDELNKVMIFMTDGTFNTAYCNSVLADGYGDDDDTINCSATNGDPTAQAEELCDAIKAQNIIVYTVAFDVSANSTEATLLQGCATTPSHYKLASNGDELRAAFRAIAIEISNLRITQ